MKGKQELERIEAQLDDYFEVEFSFRNSRIIAEKLIALPVDQQNFMLDWTRRIATTHIEIAYQFANQGQRALQLMDETMIEAWIVQALDIYDRSGLHASLKVIQQMDLFVRQGYERASSCMFDEEVGVLLPFVQGLSGRKLKLEQGEQLFTDGEVIYLPSVMAHLPAKRDNFLLYKAAVASHWAQTRFGTIQAGLLSELIAHPAADTLVRYFHRLEIERLNACLERELPGLFRDMCQLQTRLNDDSNASWHEQTRILRRRNASAWDSLQLSLVMLGQPIPKASLFHGILKPDLLHSALLKRVEREKAQLRVALKSIGDDLNQNQQETRERFSIHQDESLELNEEMKMELQLNGKSVPVPEDVKGIMTSIMLDLGEIPDDYLVPAGAGEYDFQALEEKRLSAEDVWSGTYHEDGAFLYKEWDYRRKHYRKAWCVVREMPVKEVHDGFVDHVKIKYRRLLGSLRKTFEAMRDEDQLLKRQVYGDGVDIDAFVEAWADMHIGLEMSDRLFTRMHRQERNIAVMFMVDMSGSTQGWVNQAEREALVLLAESLETLGDRYAIYGFTGMSRKRCEIFPIKTFEQSYDEEVKARISGIRAGDYTRMGAAIRHLTYRLNEVEARTKLLITLSDGKPDDYHDDYRSQYGIEDTRQALLEAHRDGVHAFCITIDEQGQDYLPHMYGAANYTVIDEIERLPLKVADIYKKITT
ncbi:MAG: nitric oxide reductase activation protein [Candidatus Thiodiazotropha sp.]|jgi:nitric oxide reductase NorD protein